MKCLHLGNFCEFAMSHVFREFITMQIILKRSIHWNKDMSLQMPTIHVRKQALICLVICWLGGGGGQNFIKGVGQEIRYFKNGLIDCGNGKKIHKNLCDIIMY